MPGRRLTLVGLTEIGDVEAGAPLAPLLLDALRAEGETLQDGDIVAVAQKIVSKSEGRTVRLADVTPTAEAERLSADTGKDARLLTLILAEAHEVVRRRAGLVIVEDVRGMVLANAGIDASNVSADSGRVLLLPEDPDASARRLRDDLARLAGAKVAVLVIDSIGRAFRNGTIGTAIGVAGMPALLDLRGRPDMFGRLLETSELGLADEAASAASLLMGQADERCPAVLLRGLGALVVEGEGRGEGRARDLVRARERDLFR